MSGLIVAGATLAGAGAGAFAGYAAGFLFCEWEVGNLMPLALAAGGALAGGVAGAFVGGVIVG